MPNNEAVIRAHIRDVPDFPEPGITFRDITPLLYNPRLFREVNENLTDIVDGYNVDVIAGIEARGFFFAVPIAERLRKPFVPMRKPGKLPGQTLFVTYDLEYGSSELEMHTDPRVEGKSVAIVDDVLATGGTALAAAQLIEESGGDVAGFAFLLALHELNGADKIMNYNARWLFDF